MVCEFRKEFEKDEESYPVKPETPSDPFVKLLQMKKTSSSEEDTKKSGDSSEDNEEMPCSSKSVPKLKKSGTQARPGDCSGTVQQVPAFYPTEKEFEDPLKYIEKIRVEAEKFGMAKIVPPKSFRVC